MSMKLIKVINFSKRAQKKTKLFARIGFVEISFFVFIKLHSYEWGIENGLESHKRYNFLLRNPIEHELQPLALRQRRSFTELPLAW